MGRRNRNRRLARRAPYRDPKPIVLVVTEGEVTEPEYLHGFVKACHNPRVHIEVNKGAGVPKTIVQAAKEKKIAAEKQARSERDDNLAYDEVWCVFDIDEHPDIGNAKEMARANGIELAISNPCIELWLWLHFAEQPGCKHRHELREMMKQHISNYDKHVNYADYTAGYEGAVRRAQALDKLAESINSSGMNPTSGMWRLTESIRSST
jgi:hypothetical protein